MSGPIDTSALERTVNEREERLSIPPDDALVLVANGSIRARRHPLVLGAVWLWTAVLGAAIAWPFSRYVAGLYGAHPRGDGPLFDGGSLPLYGLLHNAHDAAPALGGHVTVVGLFALVAGLVPLAAELVAFLYATRERRRVRPGLLVRRAMRAVPALFFLLIAGTLVEGLGVGLAVGVGALARSLGSGLGEARADQLDLAVTGLFLLVPAAIGVMHDLARAAVVRFRVGAMRGAVLGWKTFRHHALSTFFSWAWRTGAALVPVVAAALAAVRLGGRPGSALVSLFVLHQVVIGTRVALRASWLARAARAVDATHKLVRIIPPGAT